MSADKFEGLFSKRFKMKKCILVWQIPIIEGEYYSPVMYAIYIRKAKKFADVLNEYFEEKNMNWKCVLDRSACAYHEIFSSQYQVVFFRTGSQNKAMAI